MGLRKLAEKNTEVVTLKRGKEEWEAAIWRKKRLPPKRKNGCTEKTP